MAARLLVTGAGGGPANNLLRGLRAGDPSLVLVGCHHDRFALVKSAADRSYLVPDAGEPGWARAVRRVVGRERVDLFVPTSDREVAAAARLGRRLGCRVFLPPAAVVALCQDKYRLTARLARHGVPVPRTVALASLAGVGAAFRRLGRPGRLWCRLRRGSGASGAAPVASPAQARAWIAYWVAMRGARVSDFTLSEYLPGRDFFAQGVWERGRLVLLKTCERLSYFTGGGSASGVSSVSALARTVHEPAVAEVCAAAVGALGRAVSGTFNLDLKENAAGTPCVTEINAGRFASGSNIFDLAGRHPLSLTWVRVALGERVDIAEPYETADGYYSLRDLDTLPGVFHADRLFDAVVDARG